MKLYLADSTNVYYKMALKYGAKNILQSYFYVRRWMKEMKELNNECNLMMDSGAFSAWSLKKKINLDVYIEWLKKVDPDIYVGLDVIGDGEKTHNNLKYMVSKNLNPIGVFHQGENEKWLYKLFDLGLDYIGLSFSGRSIRDINITNRWFNDMFEIIIKKDSKIKVHGFGLTRMNFMKNFPWYSVDSVSWKTPVLFASNIENETIYRIMRRKTGIKKIAEIKRTLTIRQIEELLIEESVKSWLRKEEEINRIHKVSEFNNLKQISLWK